MRKLANAIVAAVTVVSCARAPTAVQSTTPAPNSSQQQLAAFQLQTACAREARAWLNERERNEGYNPNASGNWTTVVNLGTTHYSLMRHGCYAVVDQQTTLAGKNLYVFSISRELYRVDGAVEPIARIVGTTEDAAQAVEDASGILVHGLKVCLVDGQSCDSLATWNQRTRPYLEK
jgi:hypothetical protein